MKTIDCQFGCGKKATHQFKNGSWCCCNSSNSCPAKKARLDQRGSKNPMFGKSSWNKGLNRQSDDRVKLNASRMRRTKQKLSQQGFLHAWNKGLTKDTDNRVNSYGKSVSVAKRGVPNFKLRKPITKARTIGKFRHRFKRHLYTSWIFPIMERDSFQCTMCHAPRHGKHRLEVHHLIPYKIIFQQCLDKLGFNIDRWESWTDEQVSMLNQAIIDVHKPEMGVTVCSKCHGKIDPARFLKGS